MANAPKKRNVSMQALPTKESAEATLWAAKKATPFFMAPGIPRVLWYPSLLTHKNLLLTELTAKGESRVRVG